MSFPPAFLEEIRNRLPLSGVVGSRVRLARAGREMKGCCPFHNEKTPSFYVNDDKQFFHCFGCGAHGDVIGFTMRHDRLSFPEAVESLAGQAGLQVPRDTPMEREKFDAEKRLYQLLDRANAWFEEQLFTPAGREALAYLHKRGLSDEAIRRFRLGYAPNDGQALIRALTSPRHPRESGDPAARDSERMSLMPRGRAAMDSRLRGNDSEKFTLDDLVAVGLAKKADPPSPNGYGVARDRNDHYSFFRNRVIFPVGDRRGRTVAFGARILGDGEPKYLNSPDHALFHKGKLLYGLSRARAALAQGQPIIVVEGYMDVIALVEAGYSGAVAPLGTALTEDQIQILWKLLPSPENRDAGRDYSPILCFDADNAGRRAAARAVERALPLLTSAQTLRIATMSGAKDPDELIRQSGKGAFDALLKQAQPMIDVLWNMALAGRQMRTPEERGAFKDALRQRVMQIKDDSLRKLYGEEFKKRIDEAFGWKPQNQLQKRGGRRDWNNPPPQPFLGARRAPQNGQRMMERILLALIVNHPGLFDEFGESFAQMEFQTPEYAALHRRIADILSQTPDALPNAAELHRHLSDTDSADYFNAPDTATLDDILSGETYTHAKAARPDTDIDEARAAWLAIGSRLEQGRVKADYAAACAQYRETPTEDNHRRMEALRNRLMAFADSEAEEILRASER